MFLALSFAIATTVSAPERVEVLKSEIVAIAAANQLRQDNLAEVRADIQPLVDELVSLVPVRTEAQKKGEVLGAWHNLWSDMPFGPALDYTHIYQTVHEGGYYYNISRELPPSGERTGFLRGSFTDAGDRYNIVFTRNFSVESWLPVGTRLLSAGAAAEQGTITGDDQPGPVGVRGELQNTYVDSELRIVTGKSTTDSKTSLFVLERVETVE